jgi:hypothetical protein
MPVHHALALILALQSWTFGQLLKPPSGADVSRILGDHAGEFVLLVPCARGMALRIGEIRVQAGGDRRDAWEGAAEDAMSF